MKKQFILFTLLLTALVAHAQIVPPALYIQAKDGTSAGNYFLEDIRNITFSEGNMVVTVKDDAYPLNAGTASYALANINGIYFDYKTYGIVQQQAEDFFVWSPVSSDLTVHCAAGTAIRVYASDGLQALTVIQTVAQSPVNLSALPRGLYVVEAAGKTLKIVR